jgi:hypothetical protein
VKEGSENRCSHWIHEIVARPGDAIVLVLEDNLGFMPRDCGETHDLVDGEFGIDVSAHLCDGVRDQIDVQDPDSHLVADGPRDTSH